MQRHSHFVDHTILLLVMPQEDFHPCNGRRNYHGSLAVPGAREDSERIAAMIKENYHAIDEIIVLQDSHHVSVRVHVLYTTTLQYLVTAASNQSIVLWKDAIILLYYFSIVVK